ncbi:MAG: hypothetical protein M0R03_15310 [Novosphingobium sp.]|nr:hypothetical protein [Novosphingobium sp.]
MDDVPGLNEVPGEQPRRPDAAAPPPSASKGGFDFNNPTIISLLYLASCVTIVTGIVGVVLAYNWRSDARPEWEASHYEYLINTFWIGLFGTIISVVLMLVLIGFLLIWAVAILVIVRCVLSLINAQKQAPMPNPGTWLA